MDTSIFDAVQGFAAGVTSGGELKVSAAVPGTVDVNVASASGPLAVTPAGASSAAYGQVNVGTSSTAVLAQGARKGLLVANLDATKTVYLGFGGAPATTTGFPVPPGGTFALPAGVTTDDEVNAVTTSGTARVAFAEFT